MSIQLSRQRALVAGAVLLVAAGAGRPAEAQATSPGRPAPDGAYRVGHLALEDGLPGSEPGARKPLELLLAFRGAKAVYGYAKAKAIWPRYQHTDDKWVEMDVSGLRLAGDRLRGKMRGGQWWGLWPVTYEIDAKAARACAFAAVRDDKVRVNAAQVGPVCGLGNVPDAYAIIFTGIVILHRFGQGLPVVGDARDIGIASGAVIARCDGN